MKADLKEAKNQMQKYILHNSKLQEDLDLINKEVDLLEDELETRKQMQPASLDEVRRQTNF
jgi:hypothetical protein